MAVTGEKKEMSEWILEDNKEWRSERVRCRSREEKLEAGLV